MMRKQLELVVPRWKSNPKNFGFNIKSIKFLGSGVKTRVGRFSGNNKFLDLSLHVQAYYYIYTSLFINHEDSIDNKYIHT